MMVSEIKFITPVRFIVTAAERGWIPEDVQYPEIVFEKGELVHLTPFHLTLTPFCIRDEDIVACFLNCRCGASGTCATVLSSAFRPLLERLEAIKVPPRKYTRFEVLADELT